jgi:hypothetical protein
MKFKLRVFGIILIFAGIIGFLTVADDLRHKGELLGTGLILSIGLVFLALSFRLKPKA